MAGSAPAGTIARVRGALRNGDFRKLLSIRLVGQAGDGCFQAALVASVVFAPTEHSTTVGLFKAALITALPFTLLGPFVGVFIDRWRRRRILAVAPLLKVAFVGLVLFDPTSQAVPFYLGALVVLSINRFYLATASAVVPRTVPVEDLLMANSLATVGGTLALLVGVFVGGKIAGAEGTTPVVVIAGVGWLLAALIAARIRSDLAPMTIRGPATALHNEVHRVVVEMVDGARMLVRTPRALGPITSITLDQVGQGVILTLALVEFRDVLGAGVGSFSNVIGAGGVGVLLGIATIGALEQRFSKERIVGAAFVLGGVALVLTGLYLRGWSILAASLVVGVAFAWKKIPVDTMVQESLPDGYRGRVFSVYDVFYNSARTIAAALAIALVPLLGTRGSVVLIGAIFLVYAPVLPRWVGGIPDIRLVFVEGGRAEEWPRALRWGAAEEPVEVIRSWLEERDGERRRCFRLSLQDGTVLDVSRAEPDGRWTIDREREDEPTG
ncbi:MAG TPA: MFS transporter [Actinomycetota bacterium]|nr:MFS transporter [Actinomycetota bacterium]